MKALSDLLGGRGNDIELDEAALLLARIEYPDLDIEPSLRTLDSYAENLAVRLRGGETFLAAANRYLFEELGFSGNKADYYNPANSCLNEVLTSKKGLPITLSVMYLEIARRLGEPVFGIGLPGHFIVRYGGGSAATYIDPFHGGQFLCEADCYELAGAAANPTLLAPVNKSQIISRMVNNLRAVYFSRSAHRKTLRILDLLIEANPQSPEEYRQRAIAHLQLEQLRAGKMDLERYLQLAPTAADRQEVEKEVVSLTRRLAAMN